MNKKSTDRLTVVVADDNRQWLSLVGRWYEEFEAEASEPIALRLVKCRKLVDVEKHLLKRNSSTDKTLVLLDLDWKGDKKQSLALVRKLRQKSDLGSYRIIVYSESDDPKDMNSAFEADADGYLHKGKLKPEDQFKSLLTLWMEQVHGPFWLTNRVLP